MRDANLGDLPRATADVLPMRDSGPRLNPSIGGVQHGQGAVGRFRAGLTGHPRWDEAEEAGREAFAGRVPGPYGSSRSTP